MKQGKISFLEEQFIKMKNEKTKDKQFLIAEFLSFWKHYDLVFNTVHRNTVEILYFSDVNLTDIARENHFDDKTLYNYRTLYMNLFIALCDELNIIYKVYRKNESGKTFPNHIDKIKL